MGRTPPERLLGEACSRAARCRARTCAGAAACAAPHGPHARRTAFRSESDAGREGRSDGRRGGRGRGEREAEGDG